MSAGGMRGSGMVAEPPVGSQCPLLCTKVPEVTEEPVGNGSREALSLLRVPQKSLY